MTYNELRYFCLFKITNKTNLRPFMSGRKYVISTLLSTKYYETNRFLANSKLYFQRNILDSRYTKISLTSL